MTDGVRRVGTVLALVLGAALLGIVLQDAPRGGGGGGSRPTAPQIPRTALNDAPLDPASAGEQPNASEPAGRPVGAPSAPEAVETAPSATSRSLDRSSLGPVHGLVRDAVTRQPIAGAWLTWRAADDPSLERVFGGTEFRGLRGTQGFGMLSDEQGRFAVDRLADDLPPEWLLHAAARGYAQAVIRPGLAAEVVVDMERGGDLRLLGARLLPGSPIRLSALASDVAHCRFVADLLPEDVGGSLAFRRLRAGRYSVAQGEREAAVQVEAGRTTELAWGSPAQLRISGRLDGYVRESGVFLEAEQLDGHWGQELPLDPSGGFSVELPAGSYAVRCVDPRTGSERTLARVDASVQGLLLSQEASPVALEFRVVRAEGAPGGPIGLAAVGRGGDRHSAEQVQDELYRVTGAEPGRYHVFVPDAYLGEIELKGGHQPAVSCAPFVCVLRLRLPSLPPGEALRGRVRVVPVALAEDPGLARRLWPEDPDEPPVLVRGELAELRQPVGSPGSYRVVVETDLGRVERTVSLEPEGAPLEFDLR